jgi:hypothetical protein
LIVATASDSKSFWQVAESGRATALVVRLRQRSYVLPWGLFLYAEGTDAEVRLLFHTHVVTVQGAGLTSLLSDVAGQFVGELTEPDRTAKFTQHAGPHLTAVSVSENK